MADSPPIPGTSPSEPAVCARPTQWAVFALAGAVVLLVGYRYVDARTGSRPSELKRDTPSRVDLNKASRAELMQLPGLGPVRADKILAYRQANGGFQRVEDLRAVNGIGQATLDRLRPHLSVEASAPVAEASEEPLRLSRKPAATDTPKKSGKKPLPDGVIDLNHASVADLCKLPGVGSTIAQRIVDYREKKPFEKIEDLRKVGGIGATKLEQVRPFVAVSP